MTMPAVTLDVSFENSGHDLATVIRDSNECGEIIADIAFSSAALVS
jgi:hypothetical protein